MPMDCPMAAGMVCERRDDATAPDTTSSDRIVGQRLATTDTHEARRAFRR
jgi:hypothetical protein